MLVSARRGSVLGEVEVAVFGDRIDAMVLDAFESDLLSETVWTEVVDARCPGGQRSPRQRPEAGQPAQG